MTGKPPAGQNERAYNGLTPFIFNIKIYKTHLSNWVIFVTIYDWVFYDYPCARVSTKKAKQHKQAATSEGSSQARVQAGGQAGVGSVLYGGAWRRLRFVF